MWTGLGSVAARANLSLRVEDDTRLPQQADRHRHDDFGSGEGSVGLLHGTLDVGRKPIRRNRDSRAPSAAAQ